MGYIIVRRYIPNAMAVLFFSFLTQKNFFEDSIFLAKLTFVIVLRVYSVYSGFTWNKVTYNGMT